MSLRIVVGSDDAGLQYKDILRRVDGSWKIADKLMEIGWLEQRHASQASRP